MPYSVFVIHIVMIGVFPSFHIFCIAYFGRKGGSPSSRDDFHAYAFIVLGFGGNQQFCTEINKMGRIVYLLFISALKRRGVFLCLFIL